MIDGTGVDILVPSSLVRESEDARAATRKLGWVARAAAVFRADRLVVFPDREGEGRFGSEFVHVVLEYAATPPHLRKEAWGKRSELQYAGVLPPMRVSQTSPGPEGSGELREGVVTEVGPEGRVRVTCGLQHPISLHLPDGREVTEGERVAIRVSSREPVRARLVDEPLPGFRVVGTDLEDALAGADEAIATSRHGQSLSVSLLASVTGAIRDADQVAVAFGAPDRGLPAILGFAPEKVPTGPAEDSPDPSPGFDRWLDTVPQQGSDVVRTEEALFASLAPLLLEP